MIQDDRMLVKRTPYDGKPFYCETCGLGWKEFVACEERDCELETVESAIFRKNTKETDDAS